MHPDSSGTGAVTGASKAPDDIDVFFPFHIGSQRTYVYGTLDQQGSGKASAINTVVGRYTETVATVNSVFGSSVRIVGVKHTGESPDFLPCTRRVSNGEPDTWYIVDTTRIFLQCSRDQAAKLASQLESMPPGAQSEDLEYLMPLKVGAAWGGDPTDQRREDMMYEWYVEARVDVSVPAGAFKDCYRLIYMTLPDHQIRWVCPGVGLAAFEYSHHGTEIEYRSELESFNVGPKK